MGPKMERQISVVQSKVDTRQVSQIIEANLDNLPPISSRTIKVFLSSTFSDTIQERNALMEHVYPRLKTACRDKYGLEFQMMDLRWGIRDESQDDHTTIDFCLREIVNCQQQSVGPCFVAFLGQKYGYRPFPPNIKADEYEKLYDVMMNDGKTLLDRWYKKDSNVKPPVYNLQTISSILTHYNDKDFPRLQEKDRKAWDEVFTKLQTLLRHAAQTCFTQGLIDERVRDKYFVSVTEYEIYHGMMRDPNYDVNKNCMVLFRTIRDLDNNVSQHRRAQKFTDIKQENGVITIDYEARQLLNTLKQSRIPSVLTKTSNMNGLEVEWTDLKNDPSDNEAYLKQFCEHFRVMMWRLIDKCAQQADQLNRDPYVLEVIQHLTMCKTRVDTFRGRQDIIGEIERYVAGTCKDPMVLYGVSGSGKTSVIAKAFSLVNIWLPNCRPAAMLRFLGTTARSTSIRLILGCLCWQIDVMYGRQIENMPSDYPGLVNYFHESLQLATEERPLVLFLDSLDQLSSSHNAHDLTWLPKHLPPHVRIVVSTLQYEYDILDNLRSTVNKPNLFVEVQPLGLQLSKEIISDWLNGCNKTLTDAQFKVVEEALTKCSLPLYTRLIFDKICTWKSYSPVHQTQLETTVKGVINKLFDRVEKYHGKTFTCHALSYLTASKSGLSDVEMEDVLSLDDEVLNDVFTYWLPPVRRIPPLLWPRLQHELDRYIIQRESNGMIVYFWYHRQFNKVVQERYLSRKEHTLYIHFMLAHYYQGTWGGGEKKPFKYTQLQAKMLGLEKLECEADRMCPEQPLTFDAMPNQPKRLRFNLRTLSELPYHLVRSKRTNDLKTQVLFNYHWLHTKLQAMSLHDILTDFQQALEYMDRERRPKDVEIEILSNCLRIGAVNIRDMPSALSFELIGRLLPYYEQYRNIKSLIQQCDTTALKDNHLVPLFQCFEAPKGMLKFILEDHSTHVLDVKFSTLSQELISAAKDGTIAFWSMHTGERTRMIEIPNLCGAQITLHQSDDGKYLVVESDKLESPAFIYDVRTTELAYKIGRRSNLQKRCFVVGNIMVRQKTLYNVSTGECIGHLDDYIKSKSFLPCQITPNEKFILIAADRDLNQYELATHKIRMKFEGKNMPHSFAITQDSKYCYTGYNEDCLFKMFCIDPDSPQFGQTVYTFDYLSHFREMRESTFRFATTRYANELTSISISPKNPRLVLINIRRGQLIILNVEDKTQIKLDMSEVTIITNRGIRGAHFSSDAKFVVASGEKLMHIWSAPDWKFIANVNIHSVDGFPVAVNCANNLVATGSTLSTAVKVWDLDRIWTCGGAQMEVYSNPVDMVVTSHVPRLLFIRKNQRSNTYKYIDFFGIDVWNMTTHVRTSCLEYAQYGELLQMEASLDGHHIALLIKTRVEYYVWVINLKLGRILAVFVHRGCQRFVVSPDWEHVCTESTTTYGEADVIPEVKLWRVIDGGHAELETFHHATNAVFSFDNKHLFFIEKEKCVEIYDINNRRGVGSLFGDVDNIQTVPTMPDCLLATKQPLAFARKLSNASMCDPFDITYHSLEEDIQPQVPDAGARYSACTLWHVSQTNKLVEFEDVSPNGILDFSKDGRYGIDGFLQVFDIRSGKLVHDLGMQGDKYLYSLVKLTYDGQYAIWANENDYVVNAMRVIDKRNVGYICTHERPISLEVLDFGYLIVIGREDGNMLTAKLVEGNGYLQGEFAPADCKQRARGLLECRYPDGIINTFDRHYRQCINPIQDANTPLPKIHKDVQGVLFDKARVPHAVIKTGSHNDLKELEQQKRRGSSPINGRNRSKETSPVSSGANSPATLPRFIKHKHHHDNNNTLGNGYAQGFLGSGAIPKHKKDKSLSFGDLFSTSKVLQSVGSQMMALTDMAPQGPKKYYRRSDSALSSGPAELSSDSSANSSPCNTLRKKKISSKIIKETVQIGEYGTMEYRKEVGRSRFFSSSVEETAAVTEVAETLLKKL